MNDTYGQVALIREANAAALVQEEYDQLAHRALELRKAGKSFYQIAESLQLPEAYVSKMVHGAIRAASNLVSQATRQEVLHLELERLDALQAAVWPDAMGGDTRAIDSILKIMTLRMRALNLDSQQETGNTNTVIITGNSSEYQAALKMIADGSAGTEVTE